jgi:hypothetical protein
MGIPIGGRRGRGGKDKSQRAGFGNTNRQGNQFGALEIEDDKMSDALPMTKINRFYNVANPWRPAHNADDSVFHEPVKTADAPMIRSFTGTLEIGFTVETTDEVNISTLLKMFLSFPLKTGKYFRIHTL